jgi:hypothetical protein
MRQCPRTSFPIRWREANFGRKSVTPNATSSRGCPQKVRHVAVHSKDLAHIGPIQIRIEHGRRAHDPLFDAMMPLIEGDHRPGIVFQGHCRDSFVSAGWGLFDFHDGTGVLVFDEIPGSHDLGVKRIHGDDLVRNVYGIEPIFNFRDCVGFTVDIDWSENLPSRMPQSSEPLHRPLSAAVPRSSYGFAIHGNGVVVSLRFFG